jgi:EAL domain-containing protein (putative c-di-GMP-specific phosphodiesterase class I)
MAVNISARQTRDPNLINDIQEILHETNLNPKLLELEITEGIMMENVHANIQLLQDLQSIGISLAIDDFGTGYSSMAYLKRFPINQLKIDRSFVNDIHGGGEAIISAILAMAHSLGISIVAEGVETESQLVFLESIGCDLAQGYYFSRPVSRESVISLLQQQVVEGPM